MAEYTCKEGFTIREGLWGWQWREIGAAGWSAIYSSQQATINAMKAEFPMQPIRLLRLSNVDR